MQFDVMIYFDNTPPPGLLVTGVEHASYSDRIRALKIETCTGCGCRIRNAEGLCRDCSAEIEGNDGNDTDN